MTISGREPVHHRAVRLASAAADAATSAAAAAAAAAASAAAAAAAAVAGTSTATAASSRRPPRPCRGTRRRLTMYSYNIRSTVAPNRAPCRKGSGKGRAGDTVAVIYV